MFARIHSKILAMVLVAAMAGLAAGCSGSKEEGGGGGSSADLRLKLLTLPLPVDSYMQILTYDAGTDASWTLTSSADWLLFRKVSASTSGSEDVSGLQTMSGTGGEAVAVVSLANPQETTRNATITLKAGKSSKVLEVSQQGVGQDTPSGGSVLTAGWLELPETNATDGLDAFTVRFDDKSRSYTFYWDYSNLISHWVAYPLNNAIIGQSISRSNAWSYCPLLPANKQQNVSKGYQSGNHGWYARGHQIPSADRMGTFSRNAQTFYGVNMTPQNNDFNGALWASLEGKVREWAQKTYTDTLYVVTGCVEKNAKYYVLDASNKKITVPTAYFKAVLLHEKSSSSRFSDYGGYAAIAFFFDHEEYSAAGKYNAKYSLDMAMSVKALEQKLGYNLFVNLDKKVGADMANKIKSREPASSQGW